MSIEPSIDYYIQIGAVEVVGVEEDGEIVFKLTSKAKDIAPELWEAHQSHIDKVLVEMFQQGLVSVSYDENLKATVEISEEGKSIARSFGLIEFEE